MSPVAYYVPLSDHVEALWPDHLLGPPPSADVLRHIAIAPAELESGPVERVRTSLYVDAPVEIGVPGVDGLTMALSPAGGGTVLPLELVAAPAVSASVRDAPITLRVASGLLRPAVRRTQADGDSGVEAIEPPTSLDIVLGTVSLSVDADGHLGFDLAGGIALPLCLIGETGVAIEASGIRYNGGASAPAPEFGLPEGWRGLEIDQATVFLPGELGRLVGAVSLSHAGFGSGGVTGRVSAPLAVSGSLGGVDVTLDHVEVGLRQNRLTAAAVTGTVVLPFFDAPVEVTFSYDALGAVSVAVSGVPIGTGEERGGLFVLRKENVLEVTVDSLRLDLGGGATVALTGEIRPLVGGLDWPAFTVDELRIDSEGNVDVDGGWIDLPDQYSLDFYGFGFEITKVGFGRTDAGDNWIGFNGGIKFVDELAAGASVEGLRIAWPAGKQDLRPDDVRLTLEGVGVEFEVPGAVRFAGEVAFRELQTPDGLVRRFDGAIRLELPTLDLEMDGVLVIGRAPGYTFFAIYLDLSLPAGIPVFNTGLALYGLAGLFALNMEPGKLPDEAWYGTEPGQGWYRRPDEGVTDLKGKWVNRQGSLAFGAGVTLGTVGDNGYAFSSKLLLALVLPGPIVLLEGKANILKERTSLDEEPTFRTLIVFDGRAGTLTAGLNAEYRFDAANGTLIDIQAGVEAFFSFSDPDRWHVYLGERDPREKRIRAELYSLSEGTAYLMLDPRRLGLGGSIGFDKDYRFGPLSVDLEAWIEAHALLSAQPPHFTGELWLHGKVALSVFGFGLGLTADARIRADVFDPFHLVGSFRVAINLPWPLDDIGATVKAEWGPEPGRPPVPLPLQEVAIEHLKTTTTWPLPRRREGGGGGHRLLRPDHSRDGYYVAAAQDPGSVPADAPVVPLDARPRLTFGQPVHDASGVGANAQPLPREYVQIGDPEKGEGPLQVKYELRAVDLQKNQGGVWTTVARSSAGASAPDKLYGSWAPVPALPAGTTAPGSPPPAANTKLWLWSKNGYDYTRRTRGAWSEGFAEKRPGYPCTPARECFAFGADPGAAPSRPGTIGYASLERDAQDRPVQYQVAQWDQNERVTVYWTRPGDPVSRRADGLVFGQLAAGQGSLDRLVVVYLPERARSVRVRALVGKKTLPGGGTTASSLTVRATDGASAPLQHVSTDGTRDVEAVFTAADGRRIERFIEIACDGDFEIHQVCWSNRATDPFSDVAAEFAQRVRDETAHWAHEGFVLAPSTDYRIRIETRFHARGAGKLEGVDIRPDGDRIVEHAYFRTEGPPALAALSVPLQAPNPAQVARRAADGRLVALDASGAERALSPDASGALRQGERLVLDSDLDTLDKYVRRTMPETPAQGGGPPVRPAYRAYDVAVEFNEDYVDLLYRSARRGLGLYLYSRNDLPARDAAGRLLAMPNRWGRAEHLSLDAWDAHWVTSVNAAGCAEIDPGEIPRDRTLHTSPGHALDPDTVYEARLIPLLLHDDFRDRESWTETDEGPRAGAWTAGVRPAQSGLRATVAFDTVHLADAVEPLVLVPGLDRVVLYDPSTDSPSFHVVLHVDGARQLTLDIPPDLQGGPLRWEIPGGEWVDQLDPVVGTGVRGRAKGSLLVASLPDRAAPERPVLWSDYRFSVRLRPGVSHGIVVRYEPGGPHLRFTMGEDSTTHRRGFRQLAHIHGDRHTVLAQDDFVPERDREYLVTLEVVGDRVRAYQDGNLVFQATDPTPEDARRGAPALYSFGGLARFRDARVDDLRSRAPVAYRFSFRTSLYTSFFHHAHSYQDEAWPVDATAGALTAAAQDAVEVGAADSEPTQSEDRAYVQTLRSLGLDPHRRPSEVEVARLLLADVGGGRSTGALLFRSPEPLDWSRLSIGVEGADLPVGPTVVPGTVKATDLDLGTDEGVTLLVRKTVNLNGYSVAFRDRATPVLSGGPLGEGVLESYRLEGTSAADVAGWSEDSHAVRYAGNAAAPTFAVTGAVRAPLVLQARWSLGGSGTVGVVVGYRDVQNHSRFEWDVATGQRSFRNVVGGRVATLWSDIEGTDPDLEHTLTLALDDVRVHASLDGVPIFDVPAHVSGPTAYGVFCHGATEATFSELTALERDFRPSLFETAFDRTDSLRAWAFVDEPPYTTRRSDWHVAAGELRERSNLYGFHGGPYHAPGTHGAAGDPAWTDYRLRVRLRSDDDDALGVLFRYQDPDNYYRFSMDRQRGYRRLVKRVGGETTLLWEDDGLYDLGLWYDLTVECVGDVLVGFLSGTLTFVARDNSLAHGKIGLYCRANKAARFGSVRVDSAASAWVEYHAFADEDPVSAGTRIRLHSTKPAMPPENPGLVHRQAMREGQRFGGQGAHIRVSDPAGGVEHERQFHPASAFAPVPGLRLTRNADGTGCLLLWQESAARRAIYKLSLGYRRGAPGQMGPTLTQEGSSGPEWVSLHVPPP